LIFLLVVSGFNADLLASEALVLQQGERAPALNFSMLNSPAEVVSWQTVKQDVVVLDFWATWCPPCAASVPHMNALAKDFEGQPIRFISITYEPARIVKPFLEKYQMKTSVAIDHDFAMFKSYKAWGIPMIVVINKKRQVAAVLEPSTLTAAVLREIASGKIPHIPQHPGWKDPAGAEKYFRSTIEAKQNN